ncbi:MAG: ATP-binding cassette domain-containing protein [Thermoleophilia bacterium]|nr:ATP-binding cassette domain-containing protein [Thermoleophilia bacterium]
MSLLLDAGELAVISGPSGSGKSTLLRLFNRLLDPGKGEILYNGRPLAGYGVVELRRDIYYLQQAPVMIQKTVRDNLLLPFRFRAAKKDTLPPDDEKLLKLLERFKLSGVTLEDDATRMSIGQKQRLAFIRAMLLAPQVMLLDEPMSSLDPVSRAVVRENVERMATGEGTAIILVMHYNFASSVARTRRYHMENGVISDSQ